MKKKSNTDNTAGRTAGRSPGFFGSIFDAAGRAFRRGKTAAAAMSYGKSLERLEGSFFYRLFTGLGGLRMKLLRTLSEAYETSCLAGLGERVGTGLVRLPAKAYAAFVLSFSASSAAVMIPRFFSASGFSVAPAVRSMALPLLLTACFIPLFFTDRSVSELLDGSRLFREILTDGMGLLPEKLGLPPAGGRPVPFAVLAGLLSGAATLFIPPGEVLELWLSFLAVVFLLKFPDSGIVLLIAAAPFMSLFRSPSLTLGVLLVAVFVGWLGKLIRGRRVLRLTPSEVPVLLLMFAILLSGISYGSAYSMRTALLMCALASGYFLTHSMAGSEKRLRHASTAIAVPATVISLIGIAQFVAGTAAFDWLDESLFSAIPGRVTSVFENPNMLAAYLALAFPVVLRPLVSGEGAGLKTLSLLSSAAVAVCSVLTWSRSGWAGLAAGAVVLCVCVSARGLAAVPAALGAGCLCAAAFPQTVGKRLSYMFSAADTANGYRVRIWNACVSALRDFLFTGGGAGDIAFRNVYLNYSLPGTTGAPHSHSIYLQLLLTAGLPALVMLVLSGIALFRKCAGALLACSNGPTLKRGQGGMCASFAASVAALLVSGVFDYTLYNYRVFFLFCCVAGLASASADLIFETKDREKMSDYS